MNRIGARLRRSRLLGVRRCAEAEAEGKEQDGEDQRQQSVATATTRGEWECYQTNEEDAQ
jgi:hypothetical protein